MPTRATATATDAADIIRDMCLRSGDGFPDVLVVDHDPQVHERRVPGLRQVHGLVSHRRLSIPQEQQRRGGLRSGPTA